MSIRTSNFKGGSVTLLHHAGALDFGDRTFSTHPNGAREKISSKRDAE